MAVNKFLGNCVFFGCKWEYKLTGVPKISMQSIIFLCITLQLRVQYIVSAHTIIHWAGFFHRHKLLMQCSANFNTTLVTNMDSYTSILKFWLLIFVGDSEK